MVWFIKVYFNDACIINFWNFQEILLISINEIEIISPDFAIKCGPSCWDMSANVYVTRIEIYYTLKRLKKNKISFHVKIIDCCWIVDMSSYYKRYTWRKVFICGANNTNYKWTQGAQSKHKNRIKLRFYIAFAFGTWILKLFLS
jgi:hypothetical protein